MEDFDDSHELQCSRPHPSGVHPRACFGRPSKDLARSLDRLLVEVPTRRPASSRTGCSWIRSSRRGTDSVLRTWTLSAPLPPPALPTLDELTSVPPAILVSLRQERLRLHLGERICIRVESEAIRTSCADVRLSRSPRSRLSSGVCEKRAPFSRSASKL